MTPILRAIDSAARIFRRTPAFGAAVVVTLALGIAANCVIFTVMDGVYFRPLPYPDQGRLVLLNTSRPSHGDIDTIDVFTFLEWQRRTTVFASMALYRKAGFDLNPGGRPERLPGQFVSDGFFRTLGVQPSLGRGFGPADCAPGAPRVLVLSHSTWQDLFGGRPDVLGLQVRLDGAAAAVVGVMPAGFTSFMEGRDAKVWAPMPLDSAAPGSAGGGNAIGRLAADPGTGRAAAALGAAQVPLDRAFPEFYRDRRPLPRDFRASLFGGLGPGIRLLTVMAGLLLLIACGNAANLFLGRAARRGREMAVRSALGARRLQLMQGLLAESLLMSSAATVVGLALAAAGTRLLWATTAPIFRTIGVESLPFDHRVVAFGVVLTLVTTTLVGLLPAWRATRVDVVTAIRDATPAFGGRGRRRLMSRTLVVAQAALCIFTLVGTAVVLRGVLHFARVAAMPGFEPRTLLVATLPRPADTMGAVPRLEQLAEAERLIAALPGVDRVAIADRVPFLDTGTPAPIVTRQPGGAMGTSGRRLEADRRLVDSDFFAVMSMPILRGRGFTATDGNASPPVVVINQRLAAAGWGQADPVGEQVQLDGTWRTIVGVAASVVEPTPFRGSAREAYVPYSQAKTADIRVLVQSHVPPASLSGSVRRAIHTVNADQPIVDLQPMPEALDRFMTPFRLILVLVVLFAAIALVLAGVGLYSVVSYGVADRTREMGIRTALGASRPVLVRMIVREGLRLAALGLALGLLPAAALARVLPAEVAGVAGLSPLHYTAAVALWLSVSLAACLGPARRAAAVVTTAALRCD